MLLPHLPGAGSDAARTVAAGRVSPETPAPVPVALDSPVCRPGYNLVRRQALYQRIQEIGSKRSKAADWVKRPLDPNSNQRIRMKRLLHTQEVAGSKPAPPTMVRQGPVV